VRPGETRKETVLDILGKPLSFSLDPQTFHYVQNSVKISSLRRPALEKVYFYTVIFDDKDIVKKVECSQEMPWDQNNLLNKEKPS